jgi:1-aminocyclopropane-1-carboxylate deaminase/D-cysteine desulfhydrase-like pyridoxal-dependent ACC family enzyme
MSLSLFDYYPVLKRCVPHTVLASLPTPVERLNAGDQAWIKRDDMTHDEYGGNKIRKLEFIVAEAMLQNKKRIITFGAIGTNHGVATSMLCQQKGLACTVYLFDQPTSKIVQQNLRLMHYYGADLVYCGSLVSTVSHYYLTLARLNRDNYFLFAGGSNIAGTLGFVNAAFELKQQIDKGELPEPDIIICPVGSGSTLAGLTIGCQLAGMKTRVKGIRVAPAYLGPFPACTSSSVLSLMRKTQRYLQKRGVNANDDWNKPTLNDEYYGEGYGIATPCGEQAQASMLRHGIELEQTYTAKAVAAFYDSLRDHQGHCLYWHTFNSQNMEKQAEQASIEGLPEVLREFLK